MPVYGYIQGYIEIEALNKEEALKQAQDILDYDTEYFKWDERIYPREYEPKNASLDNRVEELDADGNEI
jgi:hypothetical protein